MQDAAKDLTFCVKLGFDMKFSTNAGFFKENLNQEMNFLLAPCHGCTIVSGFLLIQSPLIEASGLIERIAAAGKFIHSFHGRRQASEAAAAFG